MRLSKVLVVVPLVVHFALQPAVATAQGRVVVSHDEWFTSQQFFNASDEQFASNINNFFGLTAGQSVLLYSSDNFLTNNGFVGWLRGNGLSVTVSDTATNFSSYNAVFTEGNVNLFSTGASLAAYVFDGGNVLDIGGTGVGGAALEASYSNVFLHFFGLSFAPTYNGFIGNFDTRDFGRQPPYGADLFKDVPLVYANNGNDIIGPEAVIDVDPQIFRDRDGHGKFAAVETHPYTSVTPEPASMFLMGTGLVGCAGIVRRRRRA